jgi:hypothetical protein
LVALVHGHRAFPAKFGAMWFLSLIFAVVAAFLCLRFYAKRGERKYVLFVVGVSWSIGFFLFLVLPFDLEHAYCQRCLKRNQLDPSVCTCLPYPGSTHCRRSSRMPTGQRCCWAM